MQTRFEAYIRDDALMSSGFSPGMVASGCHKGAGLCLVLRGLHPGELQAALNIKYIML